MPDAPSSEADARRALAAVACDVAADWRLDLGRPFALALRSFAAPAGDGLVLKVTPEQDADADHEADALALWSGEGAVRLLRRDRGRRAMLIERAIPGTDLSALPEQEAIGLAVGVGRELWRPAGAPFRRAGDLLPGLLRRAAPSSEPGRELLARARELCEALLIGSDTLIHGDLHHHNILRAGDRHVAIDPKPLLGEPEFDVVTLLWNPIGHHMTLAGAERRLHALERAGLEQQRMRAWAAVRGACLGADGERAEVLLGLV